MHKPAWMNDLHDIAIIEFFGNKWMTYLQEEYKDK